MDPSFSLYDAMSAIEISDPKMDAIVQWAQYPGYPHSVSEAATKGQLKLSNHTPSELIGIIDEMLACVATWLKGHTLAQTVFTSLYLLDTTLVENTILHSVSITLIRIVEIVRDIIARAGVYAEDDQQIVCVGFNMLRSLKDEDVLAFLKTTKDHLMAIRKNLSPKDQPEENFSVLNWTRPLITAVLHRVKYLRSFFMVVSSFNKRTRESIQLSRQEISECESSLSGILSTLSLGQELDPANPLLLGFHPLINQHLLPPSYRPYGILSRENSVKLFQNILKELHTVYTIGSLNTLGDLFRAIRRLSTYEHSPNVLVRSLIAKLCFQNERSKLFGSKTMEVMIRDDIRYLFNPPTANPRSPLSSSPAAQELVDKFLAHVQLPFVDLLTVYCQHRARQRIIIGKYMDTVGDVQLESEALDTQLNELIAKLDPQRQVQGGGGGCYSTWLVYYITQLFIDFLLLGFEYQLYSPYEIHYVFWYLEYMYGWEQMSLKTAGKFFINEPPPQATGKNKKKGKAKKKELPKERELEINYLQIKRIICIGLMRAYEALMLEDKIPKPSFEFGSEALVFRHRFLPFLMVTSPQPLSYEDYKQLAGIENYKGQSINLFEAASQHFQTAKATLESLRLHDEDSKQLLKVVKTNLVIMNLALHGHKKDSKIPPTLDFTDHKAFPVIRIN